MIDKRDTVIGHDYIREGICFIAIVIIFKQLKREREVSQHSLIDFCFVWVNNEQFKSIM